MEATNQRVALQVRLTACREPTNHLASASYAPAATWMIAGIPGVLAVLLLIAAGPTPAPIVAPRKPPKRRKVQKSGRAPVRSVPKLAAGHALRNHPIRLRPISSPVSVAFCLTAGKPVSARPSTSDVTPYDAGDQVICPSAPIMEFSTRYSPWSNDARPSYAQRGMS